MSTNMSTNSLGMLAVDFGASSGRTILGRWNGSKLTVEEIHRFANDPVELSGRLYWDFLRLFHELKKGIHAFKQHETGSPASIAVDTWGVDYGFVDGKGRLLGNPYHYREARNAQAMEALLEQTSQQDLYSRSGIQPLSFNTIFQLYAERSEQGLDLPDDVRLLLMPDLFRFYLSGVRSTEYTIASTTGLLDSAARDWDRSLLHRLGIPDSLFTSIVMPGTIEGQLRSEITEELQIGPVSVVASASHDTASAVVSIPSLETDYAFISCGTWSLMGVELDQPILTEASLQYGFTNEGGAEHKIRMLKNIMGLWLLQECRRQWELEGVSLSFADMQEIAKAEPGLRSYVDAQDPVFLAPGNMPERIRRYCAETGQSVPQSKAEIIRCVVDSLAMKFKQTLDEIEELLERKLQTIHMVGGGIQNQLLCQLTANATGRPVIAGPVEATAIGNIMMQVKAHGEVSSLDQIRQAVRDSFPPDRYASKDEEQWQEAYHTYRQVIANHSVRS
ncbi:rhamnulokinase family protein [Paenibacillus sp. GCM10023248]|uniref:rhamnulokinase n=1 Tax=unclassified Paenibacillus TaxID=185978 RepID=UPI0023799660|nr:rhamnulokinase family protein [Paenibacillus sp. MAHUQ-63]MDD9268794.1 rhamnulokinase [Paenibacillus sp. MAHUQ-63]